MAVALNLKENLSEKSIAKRFNVSHNTVNRIALSFYKEYTPKRNYLTRALCFDEFKSVRSSVGAMSFIFSDANTHKIIDILEDRRLHKLKEYFSRYTIEARNAVKHIVIVKDSPKLTTLREYYHPSFKRYKTAHDHVFIFYIDKPIILF